jgi:hypothetical protein
MTNDAGEEGWRMPDLNSLLPAIPHESGGVDCCGCMIADEQGNDTELRCNECGAVLGVVNTALKDLISLVPAMSKYGPKR